MRQIPPPCAISTHAPAGGATKLNCSTSGTLKISTHAPAGGATSDAFAQNENAVQFLLTPLREGRRRLPEIMREMQRFLLTPLREGRQKMK